MKKVRNLAVLSGIVLGLLVAIVTAGLVLAQTPSRSAAPPNPCAGLNEAETDTCYSGLTDGARLRYVAWLDAFTRSGQDPRSLPHELVDYGRLDAAQSDLEATTAIGEQIIVGVVEAVRFEPTLRFATTTTLTIKVEGVEKGDVKQGESIEVRMFGGPYPNADFKGGYLQTHEAMPLLLPGDRAVLFLAKNEGIQWPIPRTGVYKVASDKVTASPTNPFKDSVDGLNETAFREEIRKAIR